MLLIYNTLNPLFTLVERGSGGEYMYPPE
jgi:hypothetical protein